MARPPSRSSVRDDFTGSPPPPQSKRDKKRNMLSEKLENMVNTFSQNLRPHYEAQASALHVDIHLITRADLVENRPLDDDPEEIDKLIFGIVGHNIAGTGAQDDFVARAGAHYTKFVHDVNDAMEERDVNLALLANKHETTRSELLLRHQYHVQLAKDEHKNLAENIRNRLIQQLSQKRSRLMKEKEQLDIGDSNALLLHPNQFNFANPASPGGAHKRATRNTGRRGGDQEETSDRRKRKALAEDSIDNQSPAPAPRVESSANTFPWRDTNAKNIYHQYEAPIYSIDRLFTDKELQFAMNNAAISATNYLIREKFSGNNQVNGESESHGVLDGEEAIESKEQKPTEEVEGDSGAQDMERTASQAYHQTRGATKNALLDLAAAAARDLPLGSALPTYIPAIPGNKANGAPPTTLHLQGQDIDADLMIFNSRNGSESSREALRGAFQVAPMEYHYRAPHQPSEGLEAFPSLLPTLGGVPMSAQSSMAGHSEGGAAMSRQASAMGGIGMKRTASGTASLLGIPNNGRNVRARNA